MDILYVQRRTHSAVKQVLCSSKGLKCISEPPVQSLPLHLLLQGMNLQLAAVMLSVGVYAYIENGKVYGLKVVIFKGGGVWTLET